MASSSAGNAPMPWLARWRRGIVGSVVALFVLSILGASGCGDPTPKTFETKPGRIPPKPAK